MKFSVVIPVYKVEAYLDQCVQSVLSQTYSDLEVILVDDGSPDRSGLMCDDWAMKDSRVRVIHQKNGGASVARNTGIRNAQGDYILFLDSDDWWETDTVLDTLAKQLEKTQVDVLTFNYRKFCNGIPQPAYFSERLQNREIIRDVSELIQDHLWVCSPWNKAVRRPLFQQGELLFRPGITSEDMDWCLRLALKAETFGFVNCCVLVYRQHAMSVSSSVSHRSVEILRDNVAYCIALLKEAGEETEKRLNPYVSYLFAVLVNNVAGLPREDWNAFMKDLKAMKYLLKYSNHPNVCLIDRCTRVVGISVTLMLLRLRMRLQTNRR